MLRTLQKLEREALERLDAIESKDELARWRGQYRGRSGELTTLLRGLGSLPADQRPAAGRRANELKQKLQAALDDRGSNLRAAVTEPGVDVSLPGRQPQAGRLHPITATMRRMRAAFGQMGFQVYDGRDVETDEHNFLLLNFSPGHPARDSHDTFYTAQPNVLLRTHTSPGQIRVMRQTGVPVRAVVPGACYRYDQPDASHNFMFYQMEVAYARDTGDDSVDGSGMAASSPGVDASAGDDSIDCVFSTAWGAGFFIGSASSAGKRTNKLRSAPQTGHLSGGVGPV